MPLEIRFAKIAPKLKNICKSVGKQCFFDIFFNFDNFLKFVPYMDNLSAKSRFFDTPWTPGSVCPYRSE